MPVRQPSVETMKASQARENFSQLLNKIFRGETRVLIEKSGIPVAALVSAEDLKRLTHFESQRAERLTLLGRMRDAFADLSEEQIEQDVARVIARVRDQARSSLTSSPTP